MLALGAGAWWVDSRTQNAVRNLPTTEVVTETQPPQAPAVRAVVVDQSDEDTRVLLCAKQKCGKLKRPTALHDEAVFDGTAWYFYTGQTAEDGKNEKTAKKILQKVSLSNTTDTLMESTPLTSPRSLFISPDGNALAFFLDNINQPKEELTELWLYDSVQRGTRVLAEKLYAPDIRSRPRWNRAGSLLWFVADTGERDAQEDRLELVLVYKDPARITAAYQALEWERLLATADHDAMDISADGTQLAYVSRSLLGKTLLNIVGENGARRQITAPGSLTHLEWLPEGNLLYVTQDSRGFTVWLDQHEVRRHVARRPGTFLSGHTDISRETLVMAVAEDSETETSLYTLQLTAGTMTDTASFSREHERVHVVQVMQEDPGEDTLAQVTRELDDEELVAFIDQHLPQIVNGQAQPVRLIVTDKINTMFVDYTLAGQEERLLLTVHDADLQEWTLRARYTQQGGEWKKVQGGIVNDPLPQRLYEWEASLERWILKTDFSLDG